MRKAVNLMLPTIAVLLAGSAWSDETTDDDRDFQRAVRDAWIDGRLEAAYMFNDHLSAFAINTDVEDGVVVLTGTVESDIERDLAAEIAEGLRGVARVDNRLAVAGEAATVDAGERVVDREAAGRADADIDDVDGSGDLGDDVDERRSFGQWVNDASTTAAVKAALIGNENIRARDINVETRDDVVTLRGTVESDQQKQLAEQLAQNTRDVEQVRNELRVDEG